MAESDRLLQTVEAVYKAGLNAEFWPDALEAVMRLVGGVAATLEVYDRPSTTLTEFHCFDIPQKNEVDYFDHYFARNPRVPLLINGKPGGIVTDYMVFDERGMGGNDFYSDFLAPTGYRYFIGGTMTVTNAESTLFSVQRATTQGHVDRTEVAHMRRLLPHVRQAFEVTRRLRSAGETGRSFRGAFDRLADGVALAGKDGKILYANEAFQLIFRSNDGIGISTDGMLEFAAGATRGAFDEAFASACRVGSGDDKITGRTQFPVPRSSQKTAYVVSVQPLFDGERSVDVDPRARAIIFVRDPSQQRRSSTDLLRAVYGLTEAEAGVARALQAAIPLSDYATAQGISVNTVYTHYQRIKDKTGCRRQGELVRKLNDILMPLLDA